MSRAWRTTGPEIDLDHELPRAAGTSLDAVGLPDLMALGRGRPDIVVAVLDGPVAPVAAFAGTDIRILHGPSGSDGPPCGPALLHGTFIAGILAADPASGVPGICPGCALRVRPVFGDAGGRAEGDVRELAAAIDETVADGARLLTVSGELTTTIGREPELERALDGATRAGALVVAAAGNGAVVASSPLTRHPGVLPVCAVDRAGRPLPGSNVARSLGSRGVAAPGYATGLDPAGRAVTRTGTSAAAAIVAGACALLWSQAPHVPSSAVRAAVTGGARRSSIVPPLLNIRRALQRLQSTSTL